MVQNLCSQLEWVNLKTISSNSTPSRGEEHTVWDPREPRFKGVGDIWIIYKQQTALCEVYLFQSFILKIFLDFLSSA